MIEVIIVAVAALGTAAFKYLTVRIFVKHASKKDLPVIARAMYSRYQFRHSRQPDPNVEQQEGGQPSVGEPTPGE